MSRVILVEEKTGYGCNRHLGEKIRESEGLGRASPRADTVEPADQQQVNPADQQQVNPADQQQVDGNYQQLVVPVTSSR